jgi:hypothetical protein
MKKAVKPLEFGLSLFMCVLVGTLTLKSIFATTYYVATDGDNGNNGTTTGSAWADPGYAATQVAAGDTVYIKSGTYQQYEANDYVMDLTTAGGNANPIHWIGYDSSPGDDPTGSDRPVLDGDKDDGDGKQVTDVVDSMEDANFFYNIVFKDATGTNIVGGGKNGSMFYNCRMTGASGDGLYDFEGLLINCELDNNGDRGQQNGPPKFFGCYVHDNTSDGYYDTSQGFIGCMSIFDTNGASGVHTHANARILNSIAYNNTTDGFILMQWNGSDAASVILGCIATDNTDGFAGDASGITWIDFSLSYNNSSDAIESMYIEGDNNSTSDPKFVNAASGDFTVESGSPVLDAGFQPSTDSGLTGDYMWNIGADQDDNAAGGGSSEHSFGTAG